MKLHGMFKEGRIGEFFGTDFVRIYPAFNIDKVKWSFVKKGDKSKCFDIFMDIDKFYLLVEQTISGKLLQKINADNGPYPEAFKYVGGENGSKRIAIGKSSKGGVLIQGQYATGKEKGSLQTIRVPAIYEDLYIMALWYKRITGDIECRGYYADMVKLFWDGYNSAQQHYIDKYDEEKDGEYIPAETETEQEPAESGNVTEVGLFKTTSEIKDADSDMPSVSVVNNTTNTTLYFSKGAIAKMVGDQFSRLVKAAQTKSVPLKIKYSRRADGGLDFVEFAT